MAAKKKPVQTLSLADLGIAADEVGFGRRDQRGASSTRSARRVRPAARSPTRATAASQLVELPGAEKFV